MSALNTKSPHPHARTTSAERPLSPHLQIYRPQLTSSMSIFHKITGIGMYAGLVALVAWLACLAFSKEAYEAYMTIANSIIGRLFLIGWTWAFFYHFSCGIRHLLWSIGKCLSLECVYKTGYISLAFSVLATIGLWTIIWGTM